MIAEFIAGLSRYDATPQGVARVAGKLVAAGWPQAGISGFVHADSASVPNGAVASSQA